MLLFVYLLHLHAEYKINIISLPVQNKIFTLQFYWHNQMFNYNIISKVSWENNQGRQVFLTHMSSKTAMCTCWGMGGWEGVLYKLDMNLSQPCTMVSCHIPVIVPADEHGSWQPLQCYPLCFSLQTMLFVIKANL